MIRTEIKNAAWQTYLETVERVLYMRIRDTSLAVQGAVIAVLATVAKRPARPIDAVCLSEGFSTAWARRPN